MFGLSRISKRPAIIGGASALIGAGAMAVGWVGISGAAAPLTPVTVYFNPGSADGAGHRVLQGFRRLCQARPGREVCTAPRADPRSSRRWPQGRSSSASRGTRTRLSLRRRASRSRYPPGLGRRQFGQDRLDRGSVPGGWPGQDAVRLAWEEGRDQLAARPRPAVRRCQLLQRALPGRSERTPGGSRSSSSRSCSRRWLPQCKRAMWMQSGRSSPSCRWSGLS